MKGAGYYFDDPVITPGSPTVRSYIDTCPPVPNQKGGMAFQNLFGLLAPLGKTELASLIVLLVLNEYGGMRRAKQKGGTNFDMLVKTIMPMGKSMLIVVSALLLLDKFSGKKTQKGGDMMKGIVNVLQRKLAKGKEQKGGSIKGTHVIRAIAPLGASSFSAALLLLVLHEFFKRKEKGETIRRKKQKGGYNLAMVLRDLLAPMGIANFLSAAGLLGLADLVKTRKKKMRGGNAPLEYVGEMPLNYTKDYKQFGCEIPEWGYNLVVPCQGGCL